jgi:hypothetical protein
MAGVGPAWVRRVTWIVLLILAALQAWSARFGATPDGVSYVDLSDAVVTGRLADLVNAYWSPLYPALLGLLRLIARPSPYWEFGLVHFLNLLLFAASIAAFEYFLDALSAAVAPLGRRELETTSGRLIAYAIFGVLSLMMTPLTLPTPDLLVTTASLVAFGAMLRLRAEPARTRYSLTLGLALAVGALAKSFIVPWSVVVFLTMWIATRRAGPRPMAIAAAAWLLFVGPWCAVLSVHQGHPTFGDTGRLTYIWNVNGIESPSLKIMPRGSTSLAGESVLEGVAVTMNARGTNPVWFDPARWYTGLRPRWEPEKQLMVFSSIATQVFSTLGPVLLIVWLIFVTVTREERRAWVGRLWIVVIPAIVAIGAYSMVLVTTRYIAPFILLLTLAVGFGLRWPSRLAPGPLAVGLGVPLMIMMATPGDNLVLAFTNATLAAVLFAWSFNRQRPAMQFVAALLGGLSVWILMPRQVHAFVPIAAVLILLLYWILSRHAIRTGHAHRFSKFMQGGLLIANGAIILIVFALKYQSSIAAPPVISGESNANWLQAEAMRQAGIGPGARIAIVGSPFEAYWARTGRLQIVGVVPPWRVAEFIGLPEAKRQVLYGEFARAGALAVVAQTQLPPIAGDSTWTPHEYIGWVKRLPVP